MDFAIDTKYALIWLLVQLRVKLYIVCILLQDVHLGKPGI